MCGRRGERPAEGAGAGMEHAGMRGLGEAAEGE